MKYDFYQQTAFSHKSFLVATGLVILDIVSLAIVLARRWDTITGEVAYLLTLGVLGLVILWWIVLKKQRILHQLLQRHNSEYVQSNSDLTAALSITSDIAIRGLLIFSICVSVLLRAAFELARPH